MLFTSGAVVYAPTAVQTPALPHDTDPNSPPFPGGVVVAWITQLLPFQRSANEPVLVLPSAVHALADTHDTPIRSAPPATRGVGVAWIAQLVPFHRSTNVRCGPLPPAPGASPNGYQPTAVHALADTHDTPVRMSSPRVGLRVVWIAQLVPFQRSANVTPWCCPTATHMLADTHDTALSALPWEELGVA
jgi:hypothetical protein